MEGSDLTASGESAATACAVVVTYNRRGLLAECLDRIERQSRPPDHVLVIDNASTDGTPAMLAERDGIETVRLHENLGSSGGFAEGLRRAHERGDDWIWLLDDDTFADDRCLETLLAGAARAPRAPSLVCSVVRWRDERLHPMNRPWFRLGRRAEFAEAAGAGLALVRTSTWVSTMVRREAVSRHGLPAAPFFVWLDDMEYTGRLLRDGTGYMVPESVAWHWTPHPYDTLTDARERFYYKARNHLWLLRGSSFGGVERLGYALAYLRALWLYLRRSDDKSGALRTAGRGIRDGLRRQPA
ncbi:MAG: rhamnopyranosyl-N-acetylglucosaminyl-diphospho-decaprenol beta,3/1,4-galactofuranosyltransferase [Solirubrobacteraceae bacterium]|nr:rhamnopyranosyl-N-acetylglucosaminyl-diphospho-decaprenol beta,3/1,4-galactofuranosyltransferase [Solirubrobacteraceae bacterium]